MFLGFDPNNPSFVPQTFFYTLSSPTSLLSTPMDAFRPCPLASRPAGCHNFRPCYLVSRLGNSEISYTKRSTLVFFFFCPFPFPFYFVQPLTDQPTLWPCFQWTEYDTINCPNYRENKWLIPLQFALS